MGCPDMYYQRCLQNFAYSLNRLYDKEKAKELYAETNMKILEAEILKRKNGLPENVFYYEAGHAAEFVYNDADQHDGCDGFNACFGGIIEFEALLGIDYDSLESNDKYECKKDK